MKIIILQSSRTQLDALHRLDIGDYEGLLVWDSIDSDLVVGMYCIWVNCNSTN